MAEVLPLLPNTVASVGRAVDDGPLRPSPDVARALPGAVHVGG